MSFAPPASPLSGAVDPRVGQDALVIGDHTFPAAECPMELLLAIEQRWAVHDYIGGVRIVQGLGGFASDFSWSGRIRGSADYCDTTVRGLEGYLESGAQITLTWRTWTYNVVMRNFHPTWRSAFRCDYAITLIVVQDLSGVVPGQGGQDVDGQTVALYSGAQNAASQIDVGLPSLQPPLPAAQATTFSQIASNLAALGEVLSNAGSVANLLATGGASSVLSVLATTIPQAQSFLAYMQGAGYAASIVFQAATLLAALTSIQKNVQTGAAPTTEFVAGGTSLYDLAARLFGDPSKALAIAQAQTPPLLTMTIPPGNGVYLVIPPLGEAA